MITNFYINYFLACIIISLTILKDSAYQYFNYPFDCINTYSNNDLKAFNCRTTTLHDTVPSSTINLRTAKKIEILSIGKEMTPDTEKDKYAVGCKSWKLTDMQLKRIIRSFRLVSSEVQTLSYSYMPCRMKGKVRIDNRVFKYWVNAGATLTLNDNSGSYYFGCSDKKCSIYFLTTEDKP